MVDMDVRDLRIGNFVRKEGELVCVESIDEQKKLINGSISIEDLEPLNIEGFLQKHKKFSLAMENVYSTQINDGFFLRIGKCDNPEDSSCHNKWFYSLGYCPKNTITYVSPIYGIHHIQNLYYHLTDCKELIVDPKEVINIEE